MAQIFFPPGIQEAISGKGLREQFDFGAGMDEMLKLRTDEQSSAIELFKAIAKDNPRLAQFALAHGNLAARLTKTPTTFPVKGEIPLGQEVRNAFAAASQKVPASLQLDPKDLTDMSIKFGERFAEARKGDPDLPDITGDQFDVFMNEFINTGSLGSAFEAAGVDTEDAGKLMTTVPGEALGLGAALKRMMDEQGIDAETQFEVIYNILTQEGQIAARDATLALAKERHALEIQNLMNKLDKEERGPALDAATTQEITDDLKYRTAIIDRNERILDTLVSFSAGEADLETTKKAINALMVETMVGGNLALDKDPVAVALFGLVNRFATGTVRGPNDVEEMVRLIRATIGMDDELARRNRRILGTGREPGIKTTPPSGEGEETDENGGGDTPSALSNEEVLQRSLQVLKELGLGQPME